LLHSGTNSNSDHLAAVKRSLASVAANPLGYGPGTAGPASLRDRLQTGFIGENYYLQLAIEVGVIGLVIFLGIIGIVGWQLWRAGAQNDVALALAASLAGISIINLFLHGWSDSTIALMWWGAAGASIRQRP
jgi:O-antigen ligase